MKSIVVDATVNGVKANIYEMQNLLNTLGIQIDFVCSQNLDKPHADTYIGKGLLSELASYVMQNEIDIVVFNNDLSPLQIRNISDICGVEVCDRSMIILRIFEMRASSKEAKLQVEIAYLKYMTSRLQDKNMDYDQVTSGGAGGATNRGAGEKAINIKKYNVRKLIKAKETELEEIARKRKEQRTSRDHTLPSVAIVGYTNAGKSTLMNRFIGMTNTNKREEVLEENRLFATLSTNTRYVKVNGYYPFLLTDTVGFISDLPTSLIKAFRSTLEEITDADLLIQVVDISDPNYKLQMKVTEDTLKEIGVKDIPMVYLYNKIDNLESRYCPFVDENELLISLKKDESMDDVLKLIDEKTHQFYVELSLHIPYENSSDYFNIKNNEAVMEVKETDTGYDCICKIARAHYNLYKKYLFR